jgi:ABC-type branched-subunit amino acid transport system ATPase component
MAVARAMMLEPDLLLIDDVIAGFDAGMIARMQAYLYACRRSRPLTILATLRVASRCSSRRIGWFCCGVDESTR